MWHWLFDCLAVAILQEHLHSSQFNFVAQLCSKDFILGLFTPQPHALSNAQSSGGPQTLWPSVQSLTTFPQDCRLHPPPQTRNVMLSSVEFDLSSLLHKITETAFSMSNTGIITKWTAHTAFPISFDKVAAGVSPTLASRFFIGHCWAADGSAIGCDTPAVSSVAVALNL